MKKVGVVLFVFVAVSFWTAAIGYYLYRNDFNQAEDYIAELAVNMNGVCNEKGSCPDNLKDWNVAGGKYSYATKYGLTGVPIYFYCTTDKKEFAFRLKHLFRSDVGIEGGVGKNVLISRATGG